MAAFLLPRVNSTARYCADWKPLALPSTPRNCPYSAGVRVASTDHCSVSVFWMCFTRAMHLSAGASWSSRSRSAGGAELVQHELQPELRGLVLHDEQQLVVVLGLPLAPAEGALGRQQGGQIEVPAVAHAVLEVGDDRSLDRAGIAFDAHGLSLTTTDAAPSGPARGSARFISLRSLNDRIRRSRSLSERATWSLSELASRNAETKRLGRPDGLR